MLMNPLALIGLVSVPALLAVYLLRNRVTQRKVSSLMLWTERTRRSNGGARLQRNRLPLLFFLELLILLLLVFAAAEPQFLSVRAARPLTVVLDDSASMGAVGRDGLTAAQRALKSVPKLIKREGFNPVQLVLAGHESRWLDAEAVENFLSGRTLDAWTLQSAAFDVEKALLLARAGSHPSAKLLVVSDTRPSQLLEGGTLRWLAVGQDVPNKGIVNAVRSGDRCMVELAGSGAAELTLKLGARSQTVSVELPCRKVFRLPHAGERFEARLPNDALAIDNYAVLLPTPKRAVRVVQKIENPALRTLMARTIAATGMASESEGACELLITDGAEPVTEPNAWLLKLTAPKKSAPYTGPFVTDYSSPLMDGISFDGLTWAGSATAGLPGLPIVMAGNVPLLTRMDDLAGRAQFFLQLDPEMSSLHYAPAWPTLFWNLLQARAAEQPGFREVNLRPGMTPHFTGPVTLPEWGAPGVVEVESGGTLFRAAYNFLDAEESDLSGCAAADEGSWLEPAGTDRHYADMTPLAILAAVVLLAIHQFIVRREQEQVG